MDIQVVFKKGDQPEMAITDKVNYVITSKRTANQLSEKFTIV